MNKRTRPISLSAQLFCGVLLSLLLAVLVFVLSFSLCHYLLEKTVYGEPFIEGMADRHFSSLQEYVEQKEITEKNLHQLNVWCSRSRSVYLTVYRDGNILYESMAGADTGDIKAEYFDVDYEDPEREYTLILSDGTVTQAFLYYYPEDAYYYLGVVIAGLISFAAFSVCFISFVHRKLRYIKKLKEELDILAGGDLSYQVTVSGRDELGELASGIDQMRRSILTHQNEEEQMRFANSQLVTAMSHDLRTPLTSLLAYLELLDRGKYNGDEQLRYFIHRSLEKTLNIKAMADKLFEYFLVYSSTWEEPAMETADADGMIQQFWGEYAFSLESKGLTVKTEFEPLNGSLRVSVDLLRRAFDNLYSNILKYADPGRPVEITCRREGEQAKMILVNHISPQRSVQESTNIGLNTCRRILRYHGGSFETAEADGVFRVELTLPLNEVNSPMETTEQSVNRQ